MVFFMAANWSTTSLSINTAFQDAMMAKEVVDQFAAMKNTMEALDVEGSAAYIREFDAKMAENAKLLGFE